MGLLLELFLLAKIVLDFSTGLVECQDVGTFPLLMPNVRPLQVDFIENCLRVWGLNFLKYCLFYKSWFLNPAWDLLVLAGQGGRRRLLLHRGFSAERDHEHGSSHNNLRLLVARKFGGSLGLRGNGRNGGFVAAPGWPLLSRFTGITFTMT